MQALQEVNPVESFIKFILIFCHKAHNLADIIVDFMNEKLRTELH